jgi:hypothetical protein
MTPEEVEKTAYWSKDQHFDYMKESGNWNLLEEYAYPDEHSDQCDRCEHDDLELWPVEAFFRMNDGTSIAEEFSICTLCMLELHGANNNHQ